VLGSAKKNRGGVEISVDIHNGSVDLTAKEKEVLSIFILLL